MIMFLPYNRWSITSQGLFKSSNIFLAPIIVIFLITHHKSQGIIG